MLHRGAAHPRLTPREDSLRRPPDAGEREDAAGLVVGLVVELHVVADKGVEVEQAHGDIGAVGLIAGLLLRVRLA